MHSLSLGIASVNWSLATLGDLLLVEASMEFLKSSRVGSKAFIAQKCANKFGRYLAFPEYEGGVRRGFVVIPKGRGGRGWACFVPELRKVLETFQTSFGNGEIACHSGYPWWVLFLPLKGAPYSTLDAGGVSVGRGSCQEVVY